mmetsp:Transcript_31809/g.56931  ORF Transcript_31809/g.56931 Transcript_31809/m.56931 type:complete len:422 (-) Transcript_31809:273-1538(-)
MDNDDALHWGDGEWCGGLTLQWHCFGLALKLRFGVGTKKTDPPPPSRSPPSTRTMTGANQGTVHKLDPIPKSLDAAVRAAGLDKSLAAAGEPNPVDAAFLSAWLEASGGKEGKTLAALEAHVRWRNDVTEGKGRVRPAQITKQLAANKTFLQALDISGRPLVLVRGSRHYGGDLPQFTRLLAFAIDGALAQVDASTNPERRIRAVLDLKGIGLRNLDAATMKELFRVIGHHYPGNLDTFWFLDAPFIFNGLWRAVKQVLPSIVTPRVAFVKRGNDGTCPELMDAFGPEALPKELGGTAELIPVEDAVQAGAAAVASRSQEQDVGIGLGHGPPLGKALVPRGATGAASGRAQGLELTAEVVVCILAFCLMYMLLSNSRDARLQQWLGSSTSNSVESKYYAAMSVLTAQAFQQAQGMLSSIHR